MAKSGNRGGRGRVGGGFALVTTSRWRREFGSRKFGLFTGSNSKAVTTAAVHRVSVWPGGRSVGSL